MQDTDKRDKNLEWGDYVIKYKVLTKSDDYIANWCIPQTDYIEEKETLIKVGEL